MTTVSTTISTTSTVVSTTTSTKAPVLDSILVVNGWDYFIMDFKG